MSNADFVLIVLGFGFGCYLLGYGNGIAWCRRKIAGKVAK